MSSASTRSTLARLQEMQDELRGMETRANQLSAANEASMRDELSRLEALENDSGVGGGAGVFQKKMELTRRLKRLEDDAANPPPATREDALSALARPRKSYEPSHDQSRKSYDQSREKGHEQARARGGTKGQGPGKGPGGERATGDEEGGGGGEATAGPRHGRRVAAGRRADDPLPFGKVKRAPPKEETNPEESRRGVRVDVEEAMRAARKRVLLAKGNGIAEASISDVMAKAHQDFHQLSQSRAAVMAKAHEDFHQLSQSRAAMRSALENDAPSRSYSASWAKGTRATSNSEPQGATPKGKSATMPRASPHGWDGEGASPRGGRSAG
ncbi:hypothetical protein T484DRAFT_1878252, partial [Baffinella frigidus]